MGRTPAGVHHLYTTTNTPPCLNPLLCVVKYAWAELDEDLDSPQMCHCGNIFSHGCLCVCHWPVRALTFWKPWPGKRSFILHFWCAGTSWKYLGQFRTSRSLGQGQGRRNTKACMSVLFGLWLLNALTYKLHFWHTGTSSEYLGQGRVSRSWGQGQDHISITICTYERGMPSTESLVLITRTWLRYVRVFATATPSVVSRLSVCYVRVPYSEGWNFRQHFSPFRHFFTLFHLTSVQNFTDIVPGELLRRRR